MDLEHLITDVLTGFQRQLKTCWIEQLNHRWSNRGWVRKNQVYKRKNAFDGLVLSVDMRNACLPPHHPPFRNLHLPLNPASVSTQTGNHNTHARQCYMLMLYWSFRYIFILITTLLMCSSDDLFLVEDDAVKSFSFHLNLVEVLPKTLFCIKRWHTMFMDDFRHLCIHFIAINSVLHHVGDI